MSTVTLHRSIRTIVVSLGILTASGVYELSLAGDDELFQKFGGKAGLVKIVEDFVDVMAADPRIGRRFVHADLRHLKLMLIEQFCELAGGPCKYSGEDMKTMHEGMSLHNYDFNALVEDLQIAMEDSGVPQSAQNKLLAKLAPMQREVVTR